MDSRERLDNAHGPASLPTIGTEWADLEDELVRIQTEDVDWKNGHAFGIVFPTNDKVAEIVERAHSMFFRLSTHHPEVFPSMRRLESDVVAMAAGLFSAEEAIGNVTCGGTESIMLAAKAARDKAKKDRGIANPEMIVPRTAYPAFAKAGQYLNIKVIRVPTDGQYRADLEAIRRAITDNTVLLAGSVPTITHGVIDPIVDMASIASESRICFHVDASLGGFQLPFLKKLGCSVPDFDFSVPGVTSLSADLHKYAYSSMGASVLLHRRIDTYQYQGFALSDWAGSTYQTPGMLGSRSGGPLASAWAVMRHLGETGYMELTKILWTAAQRLVDGINRIPGLRVIGAPPTAVIVYGSPTIDMRAIAEEMESRGWSGRPQADPPSIRLLLAPYHEHVIEAYLSDLAAIAASVSKDKSRTMASA